MIRHYHRFQQLRWQQIVFFDLCFLFSLQEPFRMFNPSSLIEVFFAILLFPFLRPLLLLSLEIFVQLHILQIVDLPLSEYHTSLNYFNKCCLYKNLGYFTFVIRFSVYFFDLQAIAAEIVVGEGKWYVFQLIQFDFGSI